MYRNRPSPIRVSRTYLMLIPPGRLGIFQISWRATTVVEAVTSAIAAAKSHADLP